MKTYMFVLGLLLIATTCFLQEKEPKIKESYNKMNRNIK